MLKKFDDKNFNISNKIVKKKIGEKENRKFYATNEEKKSGYFLHPSIDDLVDNINY